MSHFNLSYSEQKTGAADSQRKLCPFFECPPNPNCYCVNVNSLKIPNLLHFCAKHFTRCDIYTSNHARLYSKEKNY